MNEAKILTEKRGHVLVITINRPEKANAFDIETYHELAVAYGVLDTDPELRCGLVCANGKHFTAGLELDKWAPHIVQGGWPKLAENERDPFGLDPDKRVSKPLVFAMHGICYTIAIELALAADVRVCAEGSRFGQIEVKRGIFAFGGATLRMVQEFGWGNAQRYLLTGDEFNAQEALRIGLVQEVTPLGEQFECAFALAEKISRQAPLAVYGSLKSSRQFLEQSLVPAAKRLLPDTAPLMQSEDAREGVMSFIERREANFKGR